MSFLCLHVPNHIQGRRGEMMGAALIKAKGRVSSAANSQLGGHSKSMDSRHCHHHQQLPIRAIAGEQKGMRKTLLGSSYHLCRARRKRGRGKETDTNRHTKQDCDSHVSNTGDLSFSWVQAILSSASRTSILINKGAIVWRSWRWTEWSYEPVKKYIDFFFQGSFLPKDQKPLHMVVNVPGNIQNVLPKSRFRRLNPVSGISALLFVVRLLASELWIRFLRKHRSINGVFSWV